MKVKKLFLVYAALFFHIAAIAQNNERSFFMNVGFEQRFDNREFAPSDYSSSGTIFGLRLYPYVGFEKIDGNSKHRIVGGANFTKDFGNTSERGSKLLKDLFGYYTYDKKLTYGEVGIKAGIFPRYLSPVKWNTAFFSEKTLWYDPYIEGLSFSFSSVHSYIEVTCDWMGMYGATSTQREKFVLSSAGNIFIFSGFSAGYNAYMVHCANSVETKGVFDNILIEPYFNYKISLGKVFDSVELKIGLLQSLQRDRHDGLEFLSSSLREYRVAFERKSWKFQNSLFVGRDIMSLYDKLDASGTALGSRLYFGDTFFRINSEEKTAGFYDRVELWYNWSFGANLGLKFGAVFHFHNTGYSGCQQIIGLGLFF